jgi:hypothetical protein
MQTQSRTRWHVVHWPACPWRHHSDLNLRDSFRRSRGNPHPTLRHIHFPASSRPSFLHCFLSRRIFSIWFSFPSFFISLLSFFWNKRVLRSRSYDRRSVSQPALVSSTLVGLATRCYFLSECCCLKFAVLFLWGALSDERTGLQFTV